MATAKTLNWNNWVTELQVSHGYLISHLPQYGFSPTQISTLSLAYSRMCGICIFWLEPIKFGNINIFLRMNLKITTQKDDVSHSGKKEIYYLGVGPLRKGVFMSQTFQNMECFHFHSNYSLSNFLPDITISSRFTDCPFHFGVF